MVSLPYIDPVAFRLGSVSIFWYGILYALSIYLCGYMLAKLDGGRKLDYKKADLLTICLACGIVVGGRLGYVLFYQIHWFWQEPTRLFKTWEGGMSFHGGLIGCAIAATLFCKVQKIGFLYLSDILATVAPTGLFFGRLGNFINGELYGRITDVPWAITLPMIDDNPRHPSQIYEALSEGLLLQIVMWFVYRKFRDKQGVTSGAFLIGYGIARTVSEIYREPDGFIGPFTTGQALTLPCFLLGLSFLFLGKLRKS